MNNASHRAYVADLAAYNNGHLIGQWIELDGLDADAIKAAVAAVIAASPYPGAEEYAIHDWDGIPSSFGEWPDWDAVADYVEARQGLDPETLEAFELWFNNCGDGGGFFSDDYCGCFNNGAVYAEQLAEDTGLQIAEAWPYNCIDWEAAWVELRLGGDNWGEFGPIGGFHVYRNN
jgi:antirestriction protein